jgi:hypothetical protein
VENILQPKLAAGLTDAWGANGRIQSEMLIASNFGLVATVNGQTIVKAPDWVYVPKVKPISPGIIRSSYTPHLEGDPVEIVMEFLSATDCGEYDKSDVYPYGKFYFYEQILKVPTCVIFDPFSGRLEVYQLKNDRYVLQQPNAEGRYWIAQVELFLGSRYGKWFGTEVYWLRWWDAEGNSLLWGSEQADQERSRAERAQLEVEQERLRAEQAQLEVEEERSRAEQERSRAERAQLEAEQERLRAEQAQLEVEEERSRAEQERSRAERAQLEVEEERSRAAQERSRAERAQLEAKQERLRAEQAFVKSQQLAEHLRSLGIDPDAI